MSDAEQEFIKQLDDLVMNASGQTLKKFQELDRKTQLHTSTFYDAYAIFYQPSKQEKTASKPEAFRKGKRK